MGSDMSKLIRTEKFLRINNGNMFVKVVDSEGKDPRTEGDFLVEGVNDRPTGLIISTLGAIGMQFAKETRKEQTHISIITVLPDSKVAKIRIHGFVIVNKYIATKPVPIHEFEYYRYIQAVRDTRNITKYLSEQDMVGRLGEFVICDILFRNGTNLRYIPVHIRSRDMCELAVSDNGFAIVHVPDVFINADICERAIKSQPLTFRLVPQEYLTEELCVEIVEKDISLLFALPKKLRTQRVITRAVETDGLVLGMLPIEKRTLPLCIVAVKQRKEAVSFVPIEHEEILRQIYPDRYAEFNE